MGRWWYLQNGDPCGSYTPGLYSVEELNQMILVDNYVPVSSQQNILNIRLVGDFTMGEGTCWEGTYTTGVDKKYVQVLNIDFGGGSFNGVTNGAAPNVATNFQGTYDGNELMVSNYVLNVTTYAGFFNCVGGSIVDTTIKNMRWVNGSLTYTSTGSIVGTTGVGTFNNGGGSGNLLIENCKAIGCSFNSTNTTTGGNVFAGLILGYGQTGGSGEITINNCHTENCTVDVDRQRNAYLDYMGCALICGGTRTIPLNMDGCTTSATCAMDYDGSIGGGIAANCRYFNIINCINRAAINSDSWFNSVNTGNNGGIIGWSRGDGYMYNCHNTGPIRGRFGVGGIIGFHYQAGTAIIVNCSNKADIDCNVDGSNTIGGFIGGVRSGINIINCFSRGDVIGQDYLGDTEAGGFIGEIRTSNITNIVNCYAAGDVNVPMPNATSGAFVGKIQSSTANRFSECYFDSDLAVTVTTTGGAAIGKTTAELQNPISSMGIYKYWMDGPWDFGAANEYPELTENSLSYSSGKYTESEIDNFINVLGYIPISNALDLQYCYTAGSWRMGIGTQWEGTYTVNLETSNFIVVHPAHFANDGHLGIGSGTSAPYDGIFEGNELDLDGMVNRGTTTQRRCGFFGYTGANCTVKDLRLINGAHIGNVGTSSGGTSLVFTTFSGTFQDSYIHGLIAHSGASRIGGIVVENHGTIEDVELILDDATNGSGSDGLFVGLNTGSISRSKCTGQFSYLSGKRGRAGFVYSNTGTVDECSANATILGASLSNSNSAAFFGLNTGQITNCVAEGSLTGMRDRTGGFGYNNNGGTVDRCVSYVTISSDTTLNVHPGIVYNSGTITDFYYDDDLNTYTGGFGSPQTTAALQTPVSNTGIYINFGIPPWHFIGSSDYPKLAIQEPNPCPAYNPGLYDAATLNQMILGSGFIPVASAAELDSIRSGASETMGAGTCWEGAYTTGLDKKYVRVLAIDAAGYGDFQEIGSASSGNIADKWQGTYDGNELAISNLTIDNNYRGSLFTGRSDTTQYLYNIRLLNASKTLNASSASGASLLAWSLGTNSECVNCIVSGQIDGTTHGFRVAGAISAASDSALIENCHFMGTVINLTAGQTGGIAAYIENGVTLKNCTVTNSTISGNSETGAVIGDIGNSGLGCIVEDSYSTNTNVSANSTSVGGFVGYHRKGTIQRCYSANNVNQTAGSFGCGGFAGTQYGAAPTITQCYSTGDVTALSGSGHGGLVGVNRSSTISDSWSSSDVSGISQVGGLTGQSRQDTLTNSFSFGSVSGTSSVGGMVGAVVTSSSESNCYWNTETSGQATSARGTAQTTAALQTPVSNTGIYSAYSIPPWDFGTATDYPILSGSP